MAQQWVAPLLTEQGSNKIPDFGKVQSHQNAKNGGDQFRYRVDFHNVYLGFLGPPLAGAVFFFAVGFAGALAVGFFTADLPLAGALGGGAV